MGYDFKGDNDDTRESMGRLLKDKVLEQAVELFAPNASFSVSKKMRAFNYMNPPPHVNIPIVLFLMLFILYGCRAVN